MRWPKQDPFDDLDVGTPVVVANSAHAIKLKWVAVIEARAEVGEEPPCVPRGLLDKGYGADADDGSVCYRVSFDEWRPYYSCWVSARSILKAGNDVVEEMMDPESSESEDELPPEELIGEDTDDDEIAMGSDDEEFKPAQHLKKQVKKVMEEGRKKAEDVEASATSMDVVGTSDGDAINTAAESSTPAASTEVVTNGIGVQTETNTGKSVEGLELIEYGRLGTPLERDHGLCSRPYQPHVRVACPA